MTVSSSIQRVFHQICEPSRRHSPPHGKVRDESDAKAAGGKDASTMSHASLQATELCANCSKVDLRFMLENETAEVTMGSLADHLVEGCSFCNVISNAVQHRWGHGWDAKRLVKESDAAPNLFIQSRSPITVKVDGHLENPEPRLLLALDVTPPGYNENRRVIREVDRVKDRHIIAELESVPGDYDASEDKQPSLVPRRDVGPDVDYGLVQRWLRECKTHKHTEGAKEQMENGTIDTGLFSSRCGFRVIDVEEQRLVLKTEPVGFAALSYVWGRLPTILYPNPESDKVPILLTTKDNLDRLSAPKGLSPSAIAEMKDVRLPQTVLDAMEFSRRIHMRYLWIDTLCIVQDDKKDKSFLVNAMDDVYDIAAVTFIAVSGKDADAGLSGVSPRMGRPINAMAVIDDGITEHLSLSPPSLGEEVRNSVWNTRGWTFQEQALSQRCLYFTDEEVYYNCIQQQWRESYALEPADGREDIHIRTGPSWWNRKLRRDPDPTPYQYLGDLTGTLTIKDYQAAVQDYSRKTLTFPEDVLHAFEGVFNRFTKSLKSHELSLKQTQGIPVNHLHQALLWFPSDETQKRECDESTDVHFSSWSWASWNGPVEFVFADSMWLSRNITQAPLKKIPIHVLIPSWHYGGTRKTFFTQEIWEAVSNSGGGGGGAPGAMSAEMARASALCQAFAQDRIGVDMKKLLHFKGEYAQLEVGELGFVAAHLDAGDVSLEAKDGGGGVSRMAIGPHRGEFRFDDGGGEVDEYVVVVTADTITQPPDTQSIFLGLKTKNGVSRRVGLGWVYYSEEDATLPEWKYKPFRIA